MHLKKLPLFFLAAGLVLLITVGIFFLLPVQPVGAQCGSQASSCKNCHETQAKDPVNNDGTAWHTSHAFGDFCYLCHAGNNTATDKTAAHTGLGDPLKDIAASCKSCHAADFQAKAQVYATTLGVTIGSSAAAPTKAAGQPAAPSKAVVTVATVTTPAAAIPAADMVDYSQRYDQVALGKQPVNVGNIIIIVLIAALVLGGGFLVARREGWFKISFQDTKTIQGSYPADVVDMVPELSQLKPDARKNLRQILSKPATAAELFALIAKLIKKEEPPTQKEENGPKG